MSHPFQYPQLVAARLSVELQDDLAGDGIQIAVTGLDTEAEWLQIEAWNESTLDRIVLSMSCSGVTQPGVTECLATTIRERLQCAAAATCEFAATILAPTAA